MTSPPNSDPFIKRLLDETRLWQDRGIITAEQAAAITANYNVPPELAFDDRARSKLVTVLAIFGSLLVGLGVILFFAANWDQIPRAVRLALIVIGTIGELHKPLVARSLDFFTLWHICLH